MDDLRELEISMYLNNWENLQVPFGLVPDARIAVHYALPQKRKYLKSTPMTSFRVLCYETAIPFDTSNKYV